MPDKPWGIPDAAAVQVPDAGDTWGAVDIRAVTVLVKHQRRDIGTCICGWGAPGALGQSHAVHVWRELQAAGVDRRRMVPDAGDDTLIREHVAAAVQAERERMYAIADENLADLRAEYGRREQSQDRIRERLTDERDEARAALDRVREAIAEHRSSKGPAATVQVYRLDAALAGWEPDDDD